MKILIFQVPRTKTWLLILGPSFSPHIHPDQKIPSVPPCNISQIQPFFTAEHICHLTRHSLTDFTSYFYSYPLTVYSQNRSQRCQILSTGFFYNLSQLLELLCSESYNNPSISFTEDPKSSAMGYKIWFSLTLWLHSYHSPSNPLLQSHDPLC